MLHSFKKTLVAVAVLAAAVTVPSAWAQYTTGRIQGAVMDPTGAVIPGATVTLRNVGTEVTRTFVTGPNGYYVFDGVPAGDHEVWSEAEGFSRFTVAFKMFTNQTITQNLSLPLAAQQAVVEVVAEAAAELVRADAQRATTRTTLEVADLPYISRNPYFSLANLSPGVQPTFNPRGGSLAITSGSQAGAIAANGGRARATAVQLDYTDANDWEFGGQALGTSPIQDAIQEFKLLGSNWSSEHGVKSSAQVIVVTKSGTNDLHGTVYDFLQNSGLNARDYFDTTGRASRLRQNQYGFSVGGPIIRNRTFAFAAWEQNRTRGEGGTTVATVPTASARARATDPTIISLMDQFLPPPDAPTADPDIGTISSTFQRGSDSYQFIGRGDHYFNDRHSIYGRYLRNARAFVLLFPALNTLPGFDTDFTDDTDNVSLSYTAMFSPTTINQARVAYNRTDALILSQNGLISPRFVISGVVQFGALQFFPNSRLFNVYQVNDILTFVRGQHTLKVGADLRWLQDRSFLATNSQGFYIFSGLDPFLNAEASFWTQLFGPALRHFRGSLYGFFFQDDWKATPTLTLNMGVRWEIQGEMEEANGINSVLDPETPGDIGAAGSGPLGTFQVGNPAIESNPHNISPRLGFAWNPGNGSFVLRGGYGLFFDSFNFTQQTFSRSVPPLNYNFSLAGAQISGANSFVNLLDGTAPVIQTAISTVGTFGSFQNFGEITTINLRSRNPYAQQWNLTAEQGFDLGRVKNFVFRLGYVGSKGTRLTVFRPINPVVSGPAPATSEADEAARLATFQAAVASQNGVGNTRLDPRFDQVSVHDDNGNSIFHSMQAELHKSFSDEGLMFRFIYTWAKSIDTASDFTTEQQANDNNYAQDAFDQRNERAASNFDIRHRLTWTTVWQIPAFKNQVGWKGKLLGGWSFQTVNSWQTGVPGTLLAGSRLGIADVNLDGNAIPRVGLDNTRANCGPGAENFKLGDDPSNFPITQPLLGNHGTCGRNTARMKDLINFDWSVSKDTLIAEEGPLGSGPWKLHFRWEFFNIFNNPFFTASGNSWRTVSSPAFGQPNSAAASRRMQLALKLIW